jgi:hypothetical protein
METSEASSIETGSTSTQQISDRESRFVTVKFWEEMAMLFPFKYYVLLLSGLWPYFKSQE